ncbi:hypothetical protein AGMMS49941_12720 [Deferribacterales bacterium]|nr:hypothetical protein AGMMS49941_12720 [Deferribacterales bacterium]
MLLLAVCFAALAMAQDVVQNGSSAIKLSSNKMSYYSNENRSRLVGNVIVINDNYTVTADTLDVMMNKNGGVRKLDGRGNVNLKTIDMLAMAARAEIDQASKYIVLTGDVMVWQGDSFMEGSRAVFQYETHEFKMGQDNETVKINFKKAPKK